MDIIQLYPWNREMTSIMYFSWHYHSYSIWSSWTIAWQPKSEHLCWWFAKRLFRWYEWHGRTSIHCYWSGWFKFNQCNCTSTRSNNISWFQWSSIWQYTWKGTNNLTQFDSVERQRHSLKWNSEWKHKYKALFTEWNIMFKRKS